MIRCIGEAFIDCGELVRDTSAAAPPSEALCRDTRGLTVSPHEPPCASEAHSFSASDDEGEGVLYLSTSAGLDSRRRRQARRQSADNRGTVNV